MRKIIFKWIKDSLRRVMRRLSARSKKKQEDIRMNLKKEIEKRGLKAKWIAGKAGITPAYLSMIINGKRKPKKKLY